ncbi:hypothetical protein Pcinc_013327, partial [Petrolisthes cinctipes]
MEGRWGEYGGEAGEELTRYNLEQ